MPEKTVKPPVRRAKRAPRGEYAKSAGVRDAILDSAIEVFGSSGYRAGSLKRVAESLGMSEAGLLHHFPSKAAVLTAVLERRDAMSEHIVPPTGSDPVGVLQGLLDVIRFNEQTAGTVELYCVLSAEATSAEHPAHEYFVERYRNLQHRLTVAFAQLAADGRLHSTYAAEEAARVLIATLDGLQLQRLLTPGSFDRADEAAKAIRLLADVDVR